jgi:hypothetical protein
MEPIRHTVHVELPFLEKEPVGHSVQEVVLADEYLLTGHD